MFSGKSPRWFVREMTNRALEELDTVINTEILISKDPLSNLKT